MPAPPSLVLATYNIHRAIGRDGVFDPERIAEVLAELDADVIALQEVQTGTTGRSLLQVFRERLGVEAVHGVTMLRRDAEFGNVVLTRHRVDAVARLDLSVPPHEPRGALDVRLQHRNRGLRVIATHLGLRPYERREQVTRLLAALGDETSLSTVLMGDVNEWFLWGRPLRWLHVQFGRTPAPPTFPAQWPLFALDRLWVRPRGLLQHLAVHASPLARVASDHLPLVAAVALGPPTVLPPAREAIEHAA
jgi:phospholipase D1/2